MTGWHACDRLEFGLCLAACRRLLLLDEHRGDKCVLRASQKHRKVGVECIVVLLEPRAGALAVVRHRAGVVHDVEDLRGDEG